MHFIFHTKTLSRRAGGPRAVGPAPGAAGPAGTGSRTSEQALELARFLFRAQRELSSALCTPQVDLHCGAQGLRMDCESGDWGTLMRWSEGPRVYSVRLERPAQGGALRLSAHMYDQASGSTAKLFDANVLQAAVPQEFAALHAQVVEHLKQWLPVDLLQGLGVQDTPAPATQPGAGAGAAGSATNGACAAAEGAAAAPASGSAEPGAQAPAQAPAQGQESGAVKPAPWQTHIVPVQGGEDVRFTGRLVTEGYTPLVNGRAWGLRVFETRAGKYVLVKLGRSYWLGEADRCEVHVADTKEGLRAHLGHSGLGKALARELGISCYRDID
jgi:hypothetical protein